VIYLDTSALIKLYILEEGSQRVQELISAQDKPLPIWDAQEMELGNALRLKVFWGELSSEQADQQWALFEQRKTKGLYFHPEIDRINLLKEFHKLSCFTEELGCRTMDILHVACASYLSAETFVSFDVRQNTLAEKTGLNTSEKH